MKRIDTITAIMIAITELVKEANYERDVDPHKFKLRNHYISEALGLHMSLLVLHAYPQKILKLLEEAIQHYDVYTIQYIANNAKISPYNTKSVSKEENYRYITFLNAIYNSYSKGGANND